MVKRLLILLFLFASVPFAQDISVKAAVDSNKYQLGDYIGYSLTIGYNSGKYRVFLPSIKDSLSRLEFVGLEKADTVKGENNSTEIKLRYTLIGFDSGQVTIPAFSVLYSQQGDSGFHVARTDSFALYISGVAVDTTAEIKDIKEPITQPLDWKLIGLIALAVVVIAAAIYFAWQYFRKKKKGDTAEPVVQLSPYEAAKLGLLELEKKQLWQQGMVKEYHTEITGIIRTYFEKTFAFPAMEQTSGEILDALKLRNLDASVLHASEQFFTNADMVKFARFTPMPKINEDMMAQARLLIEQQNRLFRVQANAANETGGEADASR